MSNLFGLSDEHMARLRPFFPRSMAIHTSMTGAC